MEFKLRPDCQIKGLAEIYRFVFGHLETVRFVEVGAFDGLTVSNTYCLAAAGWKGLYVEPHPDFAEDCRINHKDHNVKVIETAVSNTVGEAELYVIGECSSLVWDKNAVDWGGAQDRKIKVPVTTLNKLLEEEKWEPGWELLVIDVEQNELKVLEGFTVTRWQPRMVIIEAHEKDPAAIRNFKAGPISDYFFQAGYKKIHADHINTIFVAL